MAGLIINSQGEGQVANMGVKTESQDGLQRELGALSTPALKQPPIKDRDPWEWHADQFVQMGQSIGGAASPHRLRCVQQTLRA